jgi:SWI/SNF-related matrix-associated actin-dependent regulator 1 of chromatin subfamily A
MNRTYRIDSINKQVVLEFSKSEEEVVTSIKAVSYNSRYNPVLKVWIIPVDQYSVSKIPSFIKEWGFVHKPTPQSIFEKYDYSVTDERAEELKKILGEKNFTYSPRNYQVEALHYGLEKGSFINGDDVGLGKTFEAIMYAEYTNSWPCIVICPASVKYNWFLKWLEIVGPDRTISVIESEETKKRPRIWNTDVVIINYDIIGKKQGKGSTVKFPELASILWKMFIFDEAHFLKEESSQRSKVARMLTKKSQAIIQMLTGTTTMSKPSELWNLLVILKVDSLIANNWVEYIQRYCNGHRDKYGWVYSGATFLLELNKKLRDTCYLRREKRDVLLELPPVEKVVLEVPVTNQKDIDYANENLLDFLYETKGEDAYESAMGAEGLVKLSVLRQLAIQGKLKAIEQFLRDWKVGGKKLLIFGIHREPLEYLSEKFNSKLLAGGITAIKKQTIIQDWISNDEPFLFANMSSAGTGVDGLQTVCSNMLVIELPWRPSDLEQLVARIDRSGQTDPSTVRFMLSQNTIDKLIWKMLEEKEVATSMANQGIDIVSEGSGMRRVMRMLVDEVKLKN